MEDCLIKIAQFYGSSRQATSRDRWPKYTQPHEEEPSGGGKLL
jgi:hypothetical protein